MNDEKRLCILIREYRDREGLTQQQLADKLSVSDKTVSKWERGMGLPDVEMLPQLADLFSVNVEELLSEGKVQTRAHGDNLKNLRVYVCPQCKNLLVSTDSADISCCGKRLEICEQKKADDAHTLTIEQIEDEYFVSVTHPMEKEHYIAFAALVQSDRITLVKTYAQWDFQVRLPKRHGKLVWYCTEHGLFYKNI